MTTSSSQLAEIRDALLGLGQALVPQGAMRPSGAVIDAAGEMTMLAQLYEGDCGVAWLKTVLRNHIESKGALAGGIVFDATLNQADQDGRSEALICLAEHLHGDAMTVRQAYSSDGKDFSAPQETVGGSPVLHRDRAPLLAALPPDIRKFIDGIPVEAENHCKLVADIFGVKLDYSAASIARLDDIIREGWGGKPPGNVDDVALGFGAYFGQTVRKRHGGAWSYTEETGFLMIIGAVRIYPFDKLHRRLTQGDAESLGAFYAKLITLLPNRAEQGMAP